MLLVTHEQPNVAHQARKTMVRANTITTRRDAAVVSCQVASKTTLKPMNPM